MLFYVCDRFDLNVKAASCSRHAKENHSKRVSSYLGHRIPSSSNCENPVVERKENTEKLRESFEAIVRQDKPSKSTNLQFFLTLLRQRYEEMRYYGKWASPYNDGREC